MLQITIQTGRAIALCRFKFRRGRTPGNGVPQHKLCTPGILPLKERDRGRGDHTPIRISYVLPALPVHTAFECSCAVLVCSPKARNKPASISSVLALRSNTVLTPAVVSI